MMCAAAERVISRQEDNNQRHPQQGSSGGEQGAGLRQSSNHHGNAAGAGGGGGRVMLSRAKRVAPPISGAVWAPSAGQADGVVMVPVQQLGRMMPGSARVNLLEMKAKLCKILGPAREGRYWVLLSSFLAFKLSKQELEKQLPAAIGLENISLHNDFLRAILFNALSGEAPSPPPPALQSNSNSPCGYNATSLNSHDTSKPVKGVRRRPVSSPVASDDLASSPGQPSPTGAIATPVWSNGDAITSPRKGRSGIRDRKAKDRPSPLGLTKLSEAQAVPGEDRLDQSAGVGFRVVPDLSRSLQHVENAVDQSQYPSAKRVKHELHLPNGVVGAHDIPNADEVDGTEEEEGVVWTTRPLQAPLGIPFCRASIGAPQKATASAVPGPLTFSLLGYGIEEECLEASDMLPDTSSLLRRVQQTAVAERGLQGVTFEAANVLNHGIDAYLKRILEPVVTLAQCRRYRGQTESSLPGRESFRATGANGICSVFPQKRTLNGAWSSHPSGHVEGVGGVGEGAPCENEKTRPLITPADLMGVLEMNAPLLLGEDWALLLEKLSLRLMDR